MRDTGGEDLLQINCVRPAVGVEHFLVLTFQQPHLLRLLEAHHRQHPHCRHCRRVSTNLSSSPPPFVVAWTADVWRAAKCRMMGSRRGANNHLNVAGATSPSSSVKRSSNGGRAGQEEAGHPWPLPVKLSSDLEFERFSLKLCSCAPNGEQRTISSSVSP
jgi:hypothetical protein